MGQKLNNAGVKGAPIKLRMEECAGSMDQRSNDAPLKDA
jgi:hypothetical protein